MRKHKNENSRDGSNNDESDNEVVVPDKEVWPQFVSTDGLVVQQPQEQDSVVHSVHQTENGQGDDMFKKFDELSAKMLKLAYDFRRALDEVKELNRQQRREQALVAQLGGRTDVIEAVGLQPAPDAHNKKVKTTRCTRKVELISPSHSSCRNCYFVHCTFFSFFLSVPTVIEKRSRNVPCVDARPTVPPSANVKIGRAIRWSA